MSATVTVLAQVASFRYASTAVWVVVVTPSGYVPLPGASLVTVAALQRSVAVAVPAATPVALPRALHSTARFAGHDSVGSVVSTTVTDEVQLPALPQLSVDPKATAVTPTG